MVRGGGVVRGSVGVVRGSVGVRVGVGVRGSFAVRVGVGVRGVLVERFPRNLCSEELLVLTEKMQ